MNEGAIFEFEDDIDIDGAEPMTYEPAPAGEYTVEILSVEPGQSTEGFPRWAVTLGIVDGEFAGKTIRDWWNLPTSADPKKDNKKRMLKNIYLCFGYSGTRLIVDELIKRKGRVLVGQEKERDGDRIFNNIKAYLYDK